MEHPLLQEIHRPPTINCGHNLFAKSPAHSLLLHRPDNPFLRPRCQSPRPNRPPKQPPLPRKTWLLPSSCKRRNEDERLLQRTKTHIHGSWLFLFRPSRTHSRLNPFGSKKPRFQVRYRMAGLLKTGQTPENRQEEPVKRIFGWTWHWKSQNTGACYSSWWCRACACLIGVWGFGS